MKKTIIGSSSGEHKEKIKSQTIKSKKLSVYKILFWMIHKTKQLLCYRTGTSKYGRQQMAQKSAEVDVTRKQGVREDRG
jgi:hypothetical protein